MKKRLLVIVFTLLLIIMYIQIRYPVRAVSSHISTSASSKDETVIIIANKFFISDKTAFADNLLEQYLKNTLSGIYFSHDCGKADSVIFTIYKTKFMYSISKPYFTAKYTLSDNNAYVLDLE